MYFELPFRLKGTEKIHTERFSKLPSNIYSILYGYQVAKLSQDYKRFYYVFDYCSLKNVFVTMTDAKFVGCIKRYIY